MDSLLGDLRTSLRSLRKRPGFSLVVTLTLALGIGANTAVFSVLNSVLLRPLPFREPDRLVRVYEQFLNAEGGAEAEFNYVPEPAFSAFREGKEVFQDVAAFYSYREQGADPTGGERPERVVRMPISSGFFRVLGVPLALGREFTREEEVAGVPRVVVSHGLWRRRFGGVADILGQTVELDGVVHEIVGVAPDGFRGPLGGDVDVWTPENLDPGATRNNWGNFYLSAVARLAPGITLRQAQDRLKVQARNLAMEQGEVHDGCIWAPQILPLHQDRVGSSRATLWVLMAAVGLVLLSTCVNVANLFLVRSFSRVRELAIRVALGSGRSGLVRQFLTESVVLAFLGGALGFWLAWAGVQLLVAAAPEGLPRVQEIGLNGTVLLFTLAVSLLTGLTFGLAPTLRLSAPDPARDLRDGDRGSTGGKAQNRLRSALAVSEVAVALVLLVGAGILIRSFQAIQEVDMAIEPEGVLTYEVNLPDTRYPEGADRIEFYRSLFPRIEALPGVRAVGAVSWLPSQGRYHTWGFRRVGSDSSEEAWTATDVRVVDGRYFQAMGIGLVKGRLPGAQDGPDSDPVVLINEFIANRFFGSDEPVGSMMSVSGQVRRVVGVVENVPHDPFGGMSPKVYILHDQFASNRNWAMIQTVSTDGDPEALIPGIRKSLNAVDPNLVLYRVRTMENILSGSIARQRFTMTLMGIFAGMALLLAALGIYGVLSYLVSQRHHEIGIRMALGAQRGSVRRLVIGHGMAMAGVGIAVGLLAAFYLSRWLRALTFEVESADPWVFGAVTVALAFTAWLAAFVPAGRATRVDPASAFRGE